MLEQIHERKVVESCRVDRFSGHNNNLS